MILLEHNNRIIFETIKQRLENPKRDVLDITIADFDGVQYHISTPDPEARNIVLISIQWSAYAELAKHGAKQDMDKIYGPLVAPPEPKYDFTLKLDLDNPGPDAEKLPLKISFLKRHLLAAPFKKVFGAIFHKKPPTGIVELSLRDGDKVYIKAEGDRCMIIFSVNFIDENDKVLAKVFLQEFADARRSMRNVPSVSFVQGEPPLDLQGHPNVSQDPSTGFVSFVLFEQHLEPKNSFKTINLIQSFRNYLQYHIKCSKAYMHERMRTRVAQWLQVLNRARLEPFEAKQKKLASGRTFKRK